MLRMSVFFDYSDILVKRAVCHESAHLIHKILAFRSHLSKSTACSRSIHHKTRSKVKLFFML